jgi:hypothetical protein
MFAEERPALLPLPLEPFRYYQYGERTVHLDGCVEIEAAYNWPSAWPTGSSLFRPTPADRPPWGSRDRIDPLLPVSIRTPLPPYSRRPENQRRRAACQPRWALQRPLQLPLSGPSPATRPKSAPCQQRNPRLTESPIGQF